MSSAGRYEIRSLIEGHPLVGIAPLLPPKDGTGPVIISQDVHLHGTGIWELKPSGKGDNIYQFSIVDRYPYTGVSDNQPPEHSPVIVTDIAEQNRLWYVKEIPGGPVPTFVIALADDTTLGWTVSGLGPESTITLEVLPPPNADNATLPNPFYHLFEFIPVLYE